MNAAALQQIREESRWTSRGRPALLHSFSWTLVGNVVYAACQWLIVVLIAKFGTPAMVGQFALAVAVTGPVFLLTNLALRSVQVSEVAGRFRFIHYFQVRLIGTFIGMLLICGAGLKYEAGTLGIILAVGSAKAIESISNIAHGFLQQRERLDWVARSLIVRGLICVSAVAVALAVTGQVFWAAEAYAVGFLASLLLLDFRYCQRLRTCNRGGRTPAREVLSGLRQIVELPFRAGTLVELAWHALPLGIAGMLSSFQTNIPRYTIAQTLGETKLGIFAALAYLMIPGATLCNALAESVAVRLAGEFASGLHKLFAGRVLKLAAAVLAGGVISAFVAGIFGPYLLTVLYRPEYASDTNVLVWLMIAGTLFSIGSILGTALTATRAFHRQVPLFLITCLVVFAASALLVPSHGLRGAAWSLCLSGSVQVCGAALLLGHRLQAQNTSWRP